MDELRAKAKKCRDNKKYNEAVLIYEEIIGKSDIQNLDRWLGWEYSDSLKKENQIDKAIEIAKQIYKKNTDFKHIKDLLSWTVYEKYFKNLNDNNINYEQMKQLCKIGSFILSITQHEKNLPYENTVYRIIKLLERTSFDNEKSRYHTIYKWVEKLDFDKLSKEPIQIKCDSVRNIEKASVFEEIIYLKAKCLFNIERYEEAENIATYFIKEVNRFHNDRDKWAKRLIANCEWNLGNKENSLELLKKLERLFNHWIIRYELAKKQYELGNIKESLYYSSTGILGKEPIDKKRSLIKLQSSILYDLEKYDESKYFNDYLLFIKNSDKNNIEENKSKEIQLLNKMKQICSETIEGFEGRTEGIISKILASNKAGFIQSEKESFYFKKKNVFSYNIKENAKVSFKVINSFDEKKNKETLEATDIILIS